jgi:hypothetical protein
MHGIKSEGFEVVRGLLERSELSRVEGDIRRLFQMVGGDGTDDGIKNLYRSDQASFVNAAKTAHNLPSLRRLSCNSGLIAKLQELGLSIPVENTRPVLFFSSPDLASHHFYHRAKAHQDWYGMRGSLDGLVAWFPIVPLTAEMGFLEVIPGSHKRLFPHRQEGPTFEIDGDITEGFVPVPLELGDVLLFRAFLVHRSGLNVSPRIRLAANFRYDNAANPFFRSRGFPQPFQYVRRPLEATDIPDPALIE